MPASTTYSKTHVFSSTYDAVPLPRKKVVATPVPPSEPPAPTSAARLLGKFVEAHRALADYK